MVRRLPPHDIRRRHGVHCRQCHLCRRRSRHRRPGQRQRYLGGHHHLHDPVPPDGKQAEVTLTESPVGDGEYDDAISFSQVSAGVTDEVLVDSSGYETMVGAVMLYLTDVRTVQATVCDSSGCSGCSPWWP
jgi:hypothetical protein